MSNAAKAAGIVAILGCAVAFGYHSARDVKLDSLAGILVWSSVIGISAWSGFRGRMEATTQEGLVITGKQNSPYYYAALSVGAAVGNAVGQALYYRG